MKAKKKGEPLSARSLRELADLKTESSRKKFISAHPRLFDDSVVRQLNEVVRTKLRENPHEALFLAEASVAIARRLRNKETLGRSLRSKANALYMLGDNPEALEFHGEALRIFREIHNPEEEARTLIPSIQPLILLGKYDQAFGAAEDAKKIFRQLNDEKRWAHVEINVGNIYHRQDRFEEGLACYERAYEMLLPFRDSEGLAVALYNMAVCLITLNDFPRALATYQRAREMCLVHGMTLLVTQSDYNIAYLYYLRGEYSRAIEMLRATREECEKNGDAHVQALCYLDLAEIYLELNLSTEAKESAHDGYLRFQKLGMGYEEAKCQAYEAMALSQLGKTLGALDLFARARAKFVSEKNLVWPWLMDLYQAVVLYNEGRLFEARRLRPTRPSSSTALSAEQGRPLSFVACAIISENRGIGGRTGGVFPGDREARASRGSRTSLSGPFSDESDSTGFRRSSKRLRFLPEGAGVSGDVTRQPAWRRTKDRVHEESRWRFTKVWSNYAWSQKGRMRQRSRSVISNWRNRAAWSELLKRSGPAIRPADAGQSELVRHIREMREELNWYYRRIEIEQLRAEEPSPDRIEKLQKQALAHENELLHVLREMPQSEESPNQGPAISSLENIRACLPLQTALVEYFCLKDQFIAAVLTPRRTENRADNAGFARGQLAAYAAFPDFEIQIGRGIHADIWEIHAQRGASASASALRRSVGSPSS